jgi:hypothetical protein
MNFMLKINVVKIDDAALVQRIGGDAGGIK